MNPELPSRLETPRLLLRCPRPGDGSVLLASVVESLQELRRFPASLPWAMEAPSLQVSEQYCRDSVIRFAARTELHLLMFLKEEWHHAGNIGLHAIDWRVPKCEIGFWVRTRFARQGLATEAVRALTGHAFALGMRRVEALPDDANRGSCRVCERAGYRLEGTLRNDRADPGGALRDTRVYAAVR